jgi:hypothetical protein
LIGLAMLLAPLVLANPLPEQFVPLDVGTSQKKVRCILETFQSQQHKRWFQSETFLSLMRLRGMECTSPSGYAEAFYCRKLTL